MAQRCPATLAGRSDLQLVPVNPSLHFTITCNYVKFASKLHINAQVLHRPTWIRSEITGVYYKHIAILKMPRCELIVPLACAWPVHGMHVDSVSVDNTSRMSCESVQCRAALPALEYISSEHSALP